MYTYHWYTDVLKSYNMLHHVYYFYELLVEDNSCSITSCQYALTYFELYFMNWLFSRLMRICFFSNIISQTNTIFEFVDNVVYILINMFYCSLRKKWFSTFFVPFSVGTGQQMNQRFVWPCPEELGRVQLFSWSSFAVRSQNSSANCFQDFWACCCSAVSSESNASVAAVIKSRFASSPKSYPYPLQSLRITAFRQPKKQASIRQIRCFGHKKKLCLGWVPAKTKNFAWVGSPTKKRTQAKFFFL